MKMMMNMMVVLMKRVMVMTILVMMKRIMIVMTNK